MGAGFASTDRFLAEIRGSSLRPGYVLIGDEIFLYERCRRAVLAAFVPSDLRDFCLSDIDLAETSIFEALDRAQTPSLMAPFQVLFIRNLKALLIFFAHHPHIASDPRRMDMEDKNRYERIRETLGDHCGIVELARV